MLFPQFHIDQIKRQEQRDLTRFDLDYDLPDHFLPHMVELHLSGTDGRMDHLPLDAATLERSLPLLRDGLLVCFEIFDPDHALDAVERVRTLAR